jgi:type VI secretion system protein VasG
MAAIDLKSLVDRLNEPCRRALEAAAGLTVSRTHYNVEIEHWLLRLADPADGDIAAILRHYEVDQSRLLIDLNRALDKMTTGNARNPTLSPEVVELVKQAWLLASVEQGLVRLRSGHLLWALLADETLARRARDASGQRLRIPADALKRDFAAITANNSEGGDAAMVLRALRGAAAEPGAMPDRALVIHDRSDRDGADGQDRPDPRPRADPAGRHPYPAPPEQSHPDR